MDIIDIKLANKFATEIAAGFSKVEVDGTNIIFTLNDGKTVTLTIPTPVDGISVTNLDINNNNHLICTLSNNETIDAGELPMVTPQRGIDYWTEQDETEMKNYIDESMSTAFFVEQDNENNTLIFKRIGLN